VFSLQIEGDVESPPVHSKFPKLEEQSELHPYKSPASHFSFPKTFPSPQIGLHTFVWHKNPTEGPEQSFKQGRAGPSSQVSDLECKLIK